jgi:hypothetical protein
VWVLKGGCCTDLVQEAFGTESGCELRVEDFERNRPVVLQVMGKVHRCHAAPAELALDAVAVTQGILESGGVDHGKSGGDFQGYSTTASAAT